MPPLVSFSTLAAACNSERPGHLSWETDRQSISELPILPNYIICWTTQWWGRPWGLEMNNTHTKMNEHGTAKQTRQFAGTVAEHILPKQSMDWTCSRTGLGTPAPSCLSSSLLPSSFVVCHSSCTWRRRIVESAWLLLFLCFSSYWWAHFPRSVPCSRTTNNNNNNNKNKTKNCFPYTKQTKNVFSAYSCKTALGVIQWYSLTKTASSHPQSVHVYIQRHPTKV